MTNVSRQPPPYPRPIKVERETKAVGLGILIPVRVGHVSSAS